MSEEYLECVDCCKKIPSSDKYKLIFPAICSKDHMLCNNCWSKSNARADNAKKNDFYKPYKGWCDQCIWFDIS